MKHIKPIIKQVMQKAGWDTQEVFNILSNDSTTFNDISLHAELDTLNVFIMHATTMLVAWYNKNNIDTKQQVRFDLVDWAKFKDRLKSMRGAK